MFNTRLILPPGMKLGEVKLNLWQGKVLINASSLQRYSRCPLCKKGAGQSIVIIIAS
jgi:hypothetical protein